MDAMATAEPVQFPLTLWPTGPVEPPDVVRPSAALEIDDQGWIRGSIEQPADRRPATFELVLRHVVPVDLSDSGAVLRLLDRHGVIDARQSVMARDARRPDDGLCHIDEAVRQLRVARALARTWIAHVDDEPLEDAWIETGLDLASQRDRHGRVDESAIWSRFATELNAGIAAYTMTVSADIAYAYDDDIAVISHRRPAVDLFSSACIELFNYIANGSIARRCANDRCGRDFVHQEGGAIAGQYRSKGVSYCSPKCREAHGQRERRRMKRQQQVNGRRKEPT